MGFLLLGRDFQQLSAAVKKQQWRSDLASQSRRLQCTSPDARAPLGWSLTKKEESPKLIDDRTWRPLQYNQSNKHCTLWGRGCAHRKLPSELNRSSDRQQIKKKFSIIFKNHFITNPICNRTNMIETRYSEKVLQHGKRKHPHKDSFSNNPHRRLSCSFTLIWSCLGQCKFLNGQTETITCLFT